MYFNRLPPIALYKSMCILVRKMCRMNANVVQKLYVSDNAVVWVLYRRNQAVIRG